MMFYELDHQYVSGIHISEYIYIIHEDRNQTRSLATTLCVVSFSEEEPKSVLKDYTQSKLLDRVCKEISPEVL